MGIEATPTRSQVEATQLSSLFRARASVVFIKTSEEQRVEKYVVEAANASNYAVQIWDCAQGVTNLQGEVTNQDLAEPDSVLDRIRLNAQGQYGAVRTVWILRDFLPWIGGQNGQPSPTQRRLRNLARMLPGISKDYAQSVVILTASGEIPAEINAHATVIDWPLPDKQELGAILEACLRALPVNKREDACKNGGRSAAIDAAVGLSGEEAQACFARSLVKSGKIDAAMIAAEKKRIISKEKLLEWFDPLEGGLDMVGGLETLKQWLLNRTQAWTPKAREYGLPAPKGVLLVGVPGCGKTLISQAIATAWKCPLIRWDLNALKSKFVGESEANMRKAFRTIEATGKCVVWIDEIEKALQGATSGSADGGVSADALGSILSWMQDRKGEAFVIATANDVTSLPPELLRKGRFDEIFFVDLPNAIERVGVVKAALRKYKRDPETCGVDAKSIAAKTENFTGSEIAQLIPEAMFAAFSDNAREITTADIATLADRAQKDGSILSKTAAEKIARIRNWAKGRCKFATAQEEPESIMSQATPAIELS